MGEYRFPVPWVPGHALVTGSWRLMDGGSFQENISRGWWDNKQKEKDGGGGGSA